ncbi:MAG: histidinol-phosphate transaminase [Clostridia bacterium]|jgi:histidinol-phosphate aminotransferase|nr:histidinol-phosphate transaminase [Clostridia bacterium]
MNKHWNPLIYTLDPYVPGEQPQDKKYIKLNTNENPYPPSGQALEAIHRACAETLRLYPDPECLELRKAAAAYHRLSAEQVYAGNGSDEVLAFAFLAFFDPAKTILFPDITYSFYPVYASLFGNKYELVPLQEDFTLPVEAFLKENGGVIFPNPNAPTGICLPLADIETILRFNQDSVVIVDEAYIAFGGETAAGLIKQYPNLLVIRTLSKSHSLAGLRCGYALGDKELIEGLMRVKNSVNSYPLDRLALAGAAAALDDKEYAEENARKIMLTRERTITALQELEFQVLPSAANFIFISHPRVPAEALYLRLKENGVLVRYFNKPRIHNFLRVTIGTDAEMDFFLQEMIKCLT